MSVRSEAFTNRVAHFVCAWLKVCKIIKAASIANLFMANELILFGDILIITKAFWSQLGAKFKK